MTSNHLGGNRLGGNDVEPTITSGRSHQTNDNRSQQTDERMRGKSDECVTR